MTKRVLLVDDQPERAESVGDALEAGGYEVVSACNAAECLRAADEKQPDEQV